MATYTLSKDVLDRVVFNAFRHGEEYAKSGFVNSRDAMVSIAKLQVMHIINQDATPTWHCGENSHLAGEQCTCE